MSSVPQIFDTRLRRLRRARAAAGFDAFSFLVAAAGVEIGERLTAINRPFGRAVWHGALAPPALPALSWLRSDGAAPLVPAGGLVFDEEGVPFGQGSLDLFASVLTLHAVNDLPGALSQIRRCLKTGGLFVGAMFGGRTLSELRSAMAEAEIEITGGLSPRVAPFADVRDAGGLLQRAGFAEPVADVDTLVVRYEHPLKLFADLRGMGETNVLSERRRTFLRRAILARTLEGYTTKFAGPDGRVPATFEIVYLTGWAK
jgi:SAM-dependent methyltransferase